MSNCSYEPYKLPVNWDRQFSNYINVNFTTVDEIAVQDNNLTIFILLVFIGLFFILLGLFWALVFWWSKISKKASKIVRFPLIVTLWFVLCFYSVAITSALFTITVKQHEEIEIRIEKYSFFSALGLASVFLLWTVHAIVFFVNVCCNCCTCCKREPTHSEQTAA